MILSTADFQKEVDYCASISIAKSLLQQGLISRKEYNKINAGFIKSHRPDFNFAGSVPDYSHLKKLDFMRA